MHLLKLAAGAIMLLCAGCGLFPARTDPHPARLPQDEADFARSLAHFAHGIILEQERGPAGQAAALDAFRQAAALDATNALLADLVVGRLWAQGRRQEALDEVLQRCRRRPSEPCHALLASLAEAMDRNALAAEHFGRAAAYGSPAAARWHWLQVRAWIRDGNDRRALRVLRRADPPDGGRAPGFARPFFWGQQLVRVAGEGARAKPYFELALTGATNALERALAHEGIAIAELAGGRTNDARRAVARAVHEAPGNPERIRNFIRFEFATAGAAVTSAWIRAAAAPRPPPGILLALAQLAAAQSDLAGACRWADAARDALVRGGHVPLDAGFYSLHGHLLDEAGRTEEAEALLLEALAAHPGSAQLQNHLAYFWSVHNRRLDEAEALVRRALAQEPDNGAFLDTLGWIHYRQGRYAEALEQLLLAARTEGDDPTVMDHLGDVFLALGRRAEALVYWRRSLRLQPDAAAVREKIRRTSREPAS
ncbi:MAG: tetratricopeptide repeat protein [Lentisphaerae bacterium]|nr:tetratricopeptide repeat protein [Lentisphaerota bacterium]